MKKLLWLLLCAFPVFSQVGPAPNINMQTLGACGITDATTIFNNATAQATNSGQAIYIPGGCVINHSSTLLLNGLQLVGDGLGSILNASDTSTTPNAALYIKGNGLVVRGINFTSSYTGTTRSSQVYSAAIAIRFGQSDTLTNFFIDHNYFTGKFAGPMIEIDYAGSHGDISFNTISGTALSNPTIYQGPVSYLDIHDNDMYGTSGDTCIEIVDYTGASTSVTQQVNAHDNKLANCGAHGISVLGASHTNVDNNIIYSAAGRCIYIAVETTSTESAGDHVNVTNNQCYNTNSTLSDGDIFVSGSSTTLLLTDVNISNNIIHMNAAASGIAIGGCAGCTTSQTEVARVNVTGNIINGIIGTTYGGVSLSGGVNDVLIANNTMSGGIYDCIGFGNNNTGVIKIVDNHCLNFTRSAINLGSVTTTTYQVLGNDYEGSAPAEFMLCGASFNAMYNENSGTSAGISGCANKFTAAGTGCTIATTTGSSPASGTFTLATGPCTAVVLTMGIVNPWGGPAATGWACDPRDRTSPTTLLGQTASSTTTATISIPAGAGTADVVSFNCAPY